MKFSLIQLENISKNRPQGYKEDVLNLSKRIDENIYELDDESYAKLAEKYRTPSFTEKIKNISIAAKDVVKNGREARSEDEIIQNSTICTKCPFLIANSFRCGQCGCFLSVKLTLKTWHCPIKKW